MRFEPQGRRFTNSHYYYCQVNPQSQSLCKHETKHTYTNIRQNFPRVSPFNITLVKTVNITLVKRAHKARTCWYGRPFRLIYRYEIKEKKKRNEKRKGQTIQKQSNKNKQTNVMYKCIKTNTSSTWQQAAHTNAMMPRTILVPGYRREKERWTRTTTCNAKPVQPSPAVAAAAEALLTMPRRRQGCRHQRQSARWTRLAGYREEKAARILSRSASALSSASVLEAGPACACGNRYTSV